MNIQHIVMAARRLAAQDLHTLDLARKRDAVGLIMGFVIGMNLDIPASPITNLVAYHIEKNEPIAVKALEEINKMEYINTNIALEVIRNVYQFRYNVVYNSAFTLNLIDVIFNGTAAKFPPKVEEVILSLDKQVLAKVCNYYHMGN